ncbi:hypothetical protein CVT26_010877, partial [Gymnopilus dilepis]
EWKEVKELGRARASLRSEEPKSRGSNQTLSDFYTLPQMVSTHVMAVSVVVADRCAVLLHDRNGSSRLYVVFHWPNRSLIATAGRKAGAWRYSSRTDDLDHLIRAAYLNGYSILPNLDAELGWLWGEIVDQRPARSLFGPGLSSRILLAACSANEKAGEEGGRGKFTKALESAFKVVPPDQISYVELLARLENIVGRNPQLEGNNPHRMLFNSQVTTPHRHPYEVHTDDNGNGILQASSTPEQRLNLLNVILNFRLLEARAVTSQPTFSGKNILCLLYGTVPMFSVDGDLASWITGYLGTSG